ncbi:hypothetical protein GW17_00002807 [Ensete ventricosum]|nr:hypothetical protein GW17_00002807 [Ensete ventricosum]
MDPRRTSVSNLTRWHGKPGEKSCITFLNSVLPRRILYYKRGEWTDFPESAREVVIDGFRQQMPWMYVLFGCELLRVDLLCMVMSNTTTNKRTSVGWIDEADRCFFPSLAFDEGADEPSEPVPPPQMVTPVIAGPAIGPPAPEANNEHNLERDSLHFGFIQNLFLSGMPSVVKPENVLCISEYAPRNANASVHYNVFLWRLRSMSPRHRNAYVHYAWFGSTTQEILGILAHGFCSTVAPTARAVFGSGIYLTPSGRSFSRCFVL